MKTGLLTRAECTAMRGIAILGIVLHNYCHFIGRIVKENEYQYFSSNNDRLWQVLTHPDELLPVHLLSYFGHYGVPVFLFLSGFGLVMKYEEAGSPVKVGIMGFIRYHYLKLLRMLIVGFTLFLVIDAVTPGRFHFEWENVIAQLLMYINVMPTPDKIIWPGIYWFFGLMMELYIVYRLLFFRRKSIVVLLLIVICWLAQAFCTPDGEILNRLRYNFIGGMFPFGLGILSGRFQTLQTKRTDSSNESPKEPGRWVWVFLFIASTLLTLLMSYSFHAWLWVPVVIILGTIALVKVMPQQLLRVFVWFGGISAAMFVAHPIARKLFITVAWKQDIYDGLMLYIVVTIALSWAVKQLIDRIPSPRI